MSREPRGVIGEVVGYHAGWTYSNYERAIIAGVTKTTVSIIRNGERLTFNRSNWRERGSSNSSHPASIVNEDMLNYMLASQKIREADIAFRNQKKPVLENLKTDLQYTRNAAYYQELARQLTEMAAEVMVHAGHMAGLEQIAQVHGEKVYPTRKVAESA